MAINDEIVRLILDIQKSGQTPETIKALEQFRDKAVAADTATQALGKSGVNTGQSLLQTGRIIQDFAQGGLGGILNNIEGATMALGLGAGMGGVLTVLGVVALTAGPAVKSFFKTLIDGSNEVPKVKEGVEGLTQTIKDNGEALDALRKQQSLTNSELKEFNRLTEEQVELEKKLKIAKKEAKDEEKLAGLRPPGEEEAERARAEILQGEVGGKQDEITNIVDQQIVRQHIQAQRSFENLPEGDPRRLKAMKEAGRLFRLRMTKGAARDMVRNAVVGGKEADINQVLDFLPRLEGIPGNQFRGGFERALRGDEPDAEEKEFQRQLDERSEAVRRRNAAAKKKADANKKIDDLNKQGQEGAQIAFDEMDKNREEGIRLARKAAEEAAKVRAQQQRQDLSGPRLRMVPPNATEHERDQIMLENQLMLTQNQLVEARQLQLARQINQQLRQVPNAMAGQQ